MNAPEASQGVGVREEGYSMTWYATVAATVAVVLLAAAATLLLAVYPIMIMIGYR